jgi:6-phosphogluconolactonase
MPDHSLIAIGCYTETMPHVVGAGKGIQIVALDNATGELSARHVVAGPRNPSYLALSPNGARLYAVEELEPAAQPEVHTFALDAATGEMRPLAKTPSPGSAACHIQTSRDGRLLFVSNFVSGDLLCYRLSADGVPEGQAQVIGRPGYDTARVHWAGETPDGLVLVCDAGNDTIAAYRPGGDGLDPEPVFEVKTAPGSFPRHIALAAGESTFLVAHELSVALGIFRLAGGFVTEGDVVSTLPAGTTGNNSGAAVRIHPNGRFGYMSNRVHDSIFAAEIDHGALKLKPIGTWPSGGKIPRDFALDPSGRWLVAAHQNSNDLSVFAVDAESGELKDTGHRLNTGTPVSVLFL